MTDVVITGLYADSTPFVYGQGTVRLVDGGAGAVLPGGVVVAPRSFQLDSDGQVTIGLTPNASITDPPGTVYAVTLRTNPTVIRYIEVPDSDTPVDWADIEVLAPVPPVTVPAATSGTAGQVLTVTDTGNGKKFELADPASVEPLNPAVRLGADWVLDARSCVGVNRWADQGRAGVDALNTGRGSAVIEPGAWDGLRPLSGFVSTVGATWPTLLDVRWKGRVRRQRRDPLNEWLENILVTIDSIEDLLEGASVNGPSGWVHGLDFRLAGEDSEREFLGTETFDPDVDATWRFVMDGTDVILYTKAFEADLLVHTGWTEVEREAVTDLPQTNPGSETSGPYTLAAPDEGTLLGVSFTGNLDAEVVLLDDIDGDPLHWFRASDGTDGASTVTTNSETWTAVTGLLSSAPTVPTITRSDTGWGAEGDLFDVASDQSVTWMWRGRPHPVGVSGTASPLGDNTAAMFGAGAAGWAFVSAPGFGVTWAFAISDGSGPPVVADAGVAPTGYCTVAAVLDRSDDTVKLYINGELAATADGSSLGAISSTRVEPAASDLAWVAMAARAFDADEIAWLHSESIAT